MLSKKFEFSSLIVPIDDAMKGLIRLSIENRLNHLLELEVQVHQLMFDIDDSELVKTLMRSIVDRCDSNPYNNDEIFNSISSKILAQKSFNYYQMEELSSKFLFINQYLDLGEIIKFPPPIFEVKLRLMVRDIKRMQRYIDSFLFNYQILMDTIRYVDLRVSEDVIPTAENEKLFTNSSRPQVEEAAVEEEPPNSAVEIIIPKERTKTDKILEYLLISPPLLSYLIHLIFNYFRFFNLSSIEKNNEDVYEVELLNLFPHNFTINKVYLQGLIESLEKTSLENVNRLIKSLTQFVLSNQSKLKSVEIQCSLFILFFYSLRHVFDTNRSWVFNNTEKLFSDVDVECRLLNKYVPLITGLPIKFKKSKEKELTLDETDLEEISNKYEYMKELDQNQFTEFVYGELEERSQIPPKMEINLGMKNIIDIEKLMENKIAKSNLVDAKMPPNLCSSLVNYERNSKNPKIVTKTFDLFMRFLENPIVLMTEKNLGIPNNVINLFEKMKNLLNDNNFKKEDISTLQYYHKLIPVLPDDFHFSTVLFVIYQLIIPYMYFFHNLSIFEDHFLTTYQIRN